MCVESRGTQTWRATRKGSCPLSRAQRKATTPIKGRDVLATLGSIKEALVQQEGSAGPVSWWPNKTPCSGRGWTLPWCVLQHCSPGLIDCSARDEDHKLCWNFRQNKLSRSDPAHNAGHDIDGPFEKENSLQLEDNYGNNNTQSVSINTVSRAVDQYCINGWRKTSHTHQSAVKTSTRAEAEEVAVGVVGGIGCLCAACPGEPILQTKCHHHFPNAFPGCLSRGLLLLTSALHSLFAQWKGKGSPVPTGNFPHGKCLVQFSLIKLQLSTQGWSPSTERGNAEGPGTAEDQSISVVLHLLPFLGLVSRPSSSCWLFNVICWLGNSVLPQYCPKAKDIRKPSLPTDTKGYNPPPNKADLHWGSFALMPWCFHCSSNYICSKKFFFKIYIQHKILKILSRNTSYFSGKMWLTPLVFVHWSWLKHKHQFTHKKTTSKICQVPGLPLHNTSKKKFQW